MKLEINTLALGYLISDSIRLLYNSTRKDFTTIFGEDGDYLWNKFTKAFNSKEGEFICYLDATNLEKLAVSTIEFSKRERRLS